MKNPKTQRTYKHKTLSIPLLQRGVVLLESLIAILIFSLGVLAIVGLQAAMVGNTTASKFRADASYLMQQRLGMIWADPKNADMFSTIAALDDISSLLPNGTRTVTDLGNGQVRIQVTWKAPGDTETHNVTTDARIISN
ncbi:MAG: prepilin-type cleavage/methylation domain-containing protein [Methylophilaceae bacterium]